MGVRNLPLALPNGMAKGIPLLKTLSDICTIVIPNGFRKAEGMRNLIGFQCQQWEGTHIYDKEIFYLLLIY